MSANAKEQLILEIWAETGKDSAGAAELDLIQQKLIERLGVQGSESPASIARTLADQGVHLRHPEVLEADVRWREREVLTVFTSDELNFATIEAASSWIEKLNGLPPSPGLRGVVLQIKTELSSVATSRQVPSNEREVANEVAQWLTVWLQNPAIFADWLALRREVLATKGTRST
ncbi:MAG TPA: hypothetical protein VGW58_02115 [Pyrinomonadaceae bacterium]|nr:hypothetical protein [Pyrinomonadaceae bacterium]